MRANTIHPGGLSMSSIIAVRRKEQQKAMTNNKPKSITKYKEK